MHSLKYIFSILNKIIAIEHFGNFDKCERVISKSAIIVRFSRTVRKSNVIETTNYAHIRACTCGNSYIILNRSVCNHVDLNTSSNAILLS